MAKNKPDALRFIQLLDVTVRTLKQQVGKRLQAAGMTITYDQFLVLSILIKEGGLGQKELSVKAGKDAPTLSRMVQLMVQKGWLIQEPAPGNRKERLVLPTQKGALAFKKAEPVVNVLLSEIFQPCKAASLKGVRKVCKQLNTHAANTTL